MNLYRVIEEVTDPNHHAYGRVTTIYECDDRDDALSAAHTWRTHSFPGFAHYVLDQNDQLLI